MKRFQLTSNTRKGGDYFPPVARVKFIPTGSVLLDCVLGGGWPLGRIANIVGDKSVGKCARDFYFLTSEGLFYSEDIVITKALGASPINWTLALDRDARVKATQFWKERVNLTYQIETRHGLELIATPDHKIQVMLPGGCLVMKSLDLITAGDWVVVSTGTELFPVQEVSLHNFVSKKVPSRFANIFPPNTLTPELAAWLGAVIADGTTSSGPLTISAQKSWKRALLQEWSDALFPGAFRSHPGGYAYSAQVRTLVEYLYGGSLQGTTARYKRVPTTILRSSKPVQAAFLRSLLAFDGEVSTRGIVYTTASRRLAREVQMMLLNFGVFGLLHKRFNKKYKWFYNSISVSGPRFDYFAKQIGVHRPVPKKPTRKTVSDISSIPFGQHMLQSELLAIRRRLGWSRNGKLRDGSRIPSLGVFCRKDATASYQYFESCVSKLGTLASPEFRQNAAYLLRKQFVFDKVIKKKTIRKSQIVCDVHVPEGNLFWASGFINHNTLLAIEAAANFANQYPKGLIWYREAEAAFDPSYAETLGLPVKRVDFGEEGIDTQWDTVEEIFVDLDACIKEALDKKVPGLYIIDSLDALSSAAELERDIDKGSYGMEKPKMLGKMFRQLTRKLGQANVCLIIISQVRDKIGVTFGRKWTRSGGKAMDFYASIVLYLSHIETLARTVGSLKRATAIRVRAKCEKNKIAMPFRECEVTIRFGYGMDDVEAALHWLEEVKMLDRLSLSDKTVGRYLTETAKMDWDEYLKRVTQVRDVVLTAWNEVEARFLPTRRKYA